MAGRCDRAAGDSPGSLGESRQAWGQAAVPEVQLGQAWSQASAHQLRDRGTGLSRAVPVQLRPGAGVGADMEPQGARWGPSSCCLHSVKLYLMSAGRFG